MVHYAPKMCNTFIYLSNAIGHAKNDATKFEIVTLYEVLFDLRKTINI